LKVKDLRPISIISRRGDSIRMGPLAIRTRRKAGVRSWGGVCQARRENALSFAIRKVQVVDGQGFDLSSNRHAHLRLEMGRVGCPPTSVVSFGMRWPMVVVSTGFPRRVLAVVKPLRKNGVCIAIVYHDPNRQEGLGVTGRLRRVLQRHVIHQIYRQAELVVFTFA
jgi:hypothetical protein